MKNLLQVKLAITVFLVLVGCGLLIAGIVIDPSGEIHNSVLIAFGEILTFVGTVFGMKYRFQQSLIKHEQLYRWAVKNGINLEDASDGLEELDRKQDPPSRDDGEKQKSYVKSVQSSQN